MAASNLRSGTGKIWSRNFTKDIIQYNNEGYGPLLLSNFLLGINTVTMDWKKSALDLLSGCQTQLYNSLNLQ